jgi:hypothetical protein
MSDIKKSDDGEQEILNRLENELDSMIDKLAGTDADYDPAIEIAALEFVANSDDADGE